jgi:hypothetical protein
MTATQANRKKRFKAALAMMGMTQGAWAVSRGRTLQHLNAVVNGWRESQPLEAEIDAFANSVLGSTPKPSRRRVAA